MSKSTISALAIAFATVSTQSLAGGCKDLPNHKQLQAVLTNVVQSGNGGIFSPNSMWATIVSRDGLVCAVAKIGDAWPGSRVISAQKANTANAFSNEKLSLSTANLYSAVQPSGSLYGLQHSNPVNIHAAYDGDAAKFGTDKDPMTGKRIGGVNVFGGGLALYKKGNTSVLGAIGVSGDSSCADHVIAWRMREAMQLDSIPGGVSGSKDDNIIHDIAADGKSAQGFGHPTCAAAATDIAKGLKLSSAKASK